MKKFLYIFIATTVSCTHAFADANPMFGNENKDAITLYVAQGTGPGSLFKLVNPVDWDIVPMSMIMAQYSQPMTIFRLPARQNFNVVQNIAYNSGRGLSFIGAGISWDVTPIVWRGLYVGGGIGPYMRDAHDRWVKSRLVFGEKFFIGANVSSAWRIELFTLHFSNGDFTAINRGFNFVGLSAGYSF
ncbi:acyloxyacyl hydrolase [bacterium]|nr:acyloxyacyl hydrolase [bacterium]